MHLKPSATTLKATRNLLKYGLTITTSRISTPNRNFPDTKPAGPSFFPSSRFSSYINQACTTKQMLCHGVQTLKKGYILKNLSTMCYWMTNFLLYEQSDPSH